MRRNHLSLVLLSLISMVFLASFQNCDRLKAFGNGEPYEGLTSQTFVSGQVQPGNSQGVPANSSATACEPENQADPIRSAVVSGSTLSLSSWFNGAQGAAQVPFDVSTQSASTLTSLKNGLYLQKFTLNGNRTADVYYSDTLRDYHQKMICK